jgi:tetratricopeptide (TPR) repeat protein
LPLALFARSDEDVESLRAILRERATGRFTQAWKQYRASFDKSQKDRTQSKSEAETQRNEPVMSKANDAIAEAALRTGDTYRGSANEMEAAGVSAEPAKAAKQAADINRNRNFAIAFYEELLFRKRQSAATDADLGRLLIRLAGLHYEVGDEAKADEYLARVFRIYENASQPPKKSDVLFTTAGVLEDDEEVTAAAKYFSDALKQFTAERDLAGQAETSYRLGSIYENEYRRGWSILSYEKYEQALAAYQQIAQSLSGKNIEELFHMASVWEKTGEYERALAAYRLAQQSTALSKDQEARVNDEIGSILSITGQTEGAIEVYERARAAFELLGTEQGKSQALRVSRTISALNIALQKTPPPKSSPKP